MNLFTKENLDKLREDLQFKQAVLDSIQSKLMIKQTPNNNGEYQYDQYAAQLTHLDVINKIKLDIQELKCTIEMLEDTWS